MADQIYTGYLQQADSGNIQFVSGTSSTPVQTLYTVQTNQTQPKYIGYRQSYEYKQLYSWVDYRAHNNYPFADSVGENGLPTDLILDIWLLLPPGATNEYRRHFYIKLLQVGQSSMRIQLWYNDDKAEFRCGGFQGISKQLQLSSAIDQTQNNYKALAISAGDIPAQYSILRSMSGNILVGNTAGYTGGTIQLQFSSGKLSQACVMLAQFAGVSGIACDNHILSGEISLKAGPGILLTADAQTNTITASIDFSQIFDNISSVTSALALITSTLGTPINTINGVGPDENNNINIHGIDCVQISDPRISGMLTISNKCAKPCCTQDSPTALQNNINTLQKQHQILRSYFTEQANNINYMQANLATILTASKTNVNIDN